MLMQLNITVQDALELNRFYNTMSLDNVTVYFLIVVSENPSVVVTSNRDDHPLLLALNIKQFPLK